MFQAAPGRMEAKLSNGLVIGHAYSVAGVKLVRALNTLYQHGNLVVFLWKRVKLCIVKLPSWKEFNRMLITEFCTAYFQSDKSD